MRFFGVFWIVLGFGMAAAHADTRGFSPSGEAAKETIRSREFRDHRNLVTYLQELPAEFAQDLTQLSSKQRILDGGAGALYFAEELVTLKKLGKNSSQLSPAIADQVNPWLKKHSPPNTVAISLNLEREVPKRSGLQVIWGRFFAEIPDSELGKFDLIVDLQGIFAYSPAADEVLRKYLRILRPTGTLYLSLGRPQSGFAFRSKVKQKGKSLTLAEWVRGVSGVTVRELSSSEGKGSDGLRTLQIRPIQGAEPQIPTLSLMGIDTSQKGPPTRVYWQSQKTAALAPK